VDTDQNWYRQLAALALLSASRAAVEFLTNPSSRENASEQLRGAFSQIDYDALSTALTRAINDAADTGKERLNETIDTLREAGVGAVEDAKSKAETKLGQKKKGGKMRFLIGMVLGGLVAYFLLDEQRRDDLLDRLTGASGPIEQSVQGATQQVTSTAQQAVNSAQTPPASSSAGSAGSTAAGDQSSGDAGAAKSETKASKPAGTAEGTTEK
jgi:hypothetical protein